MLTIERAMLCLLVCFPNISFAFQFSDMTLPKIIYTQKRGFTLVELLLVIAIMAVLAFVVLMAINPTRQLGKARDAQRKSDVLTILIAFYQHVLDHGGEHPTQIPYGEENAKPICKSLDAVCNNGINLRSLTGTYIADMPYDPFSPVTSTGTNYYIFSHSGNRITIFAPLAEKEHPIQATR